MKKIRTTIFVSLAGSLLISTSQAHDPSEHTAKMEKPKCGVMKNVNDSKVDVNDSVMMAMMKKCMSSAGSGGHHIEGAMENTVDESSRNEAGKDPKGLDY